MVPESANAGLREEQLDEVLASYLDAVALGHFPGRQELLARYPDLAAELAAFFEDRDRVERLAAPLREVTRHSIPPGCRSTDCADPGRVPGVADSCTPSLPPDAAAREGQTVPPTLADYEVLGELGRGGMGVVYKARQKSLKRLVALKMLHVGGGARPEELERFRAEAETVAHLEHPNIVRIHEVGRQGGVPFLCLEFVEGGSLQRRLAGSPVAARPAAQLVETLARAVHFAHERGVVHRDLKPANVLLVGAPDASPEQWVPKVTDFGLAKRIDVEAGQTPTGAVLGTPSYMAPEQARGWSSVVGPTADVCALGAILYELLTGRPPFRAATPMDTVLQVVQEEPVPPARLQPTCPRDLETVCLKCLEKDAHKRYATAQDLAADLRRWLKNEPIRARPAGVWERSVKWARRHPAIAALVAVSSLALLAGVAGIVGHHHHLQRRVEEAIQGEQEARADNDDAIRQREEQRLRGECEPLLDQAESALARRDSWEAEHLALRVQDKAVGEAALEDLKARAASTVSEAHRLRVVLKNYQQLFRGLDEALFQLNHRLFTGIDDPAHLAATRQAAHEALTLFQVASEAELGPVLDDRYSGGEKRQILLGCYHVLLILADAEAGQWSALAAGKQGAPGDRETVGRALRILERANKLVPSAQVYHLRKARYLDLLAETAAARKERALADKAHPIGPLDEFLVGSDRWLEAQQQRDAKKQRDALQHFERALQDEPKLFWARLFLAVGRLQLRQPGQARVHLTVCIDQRPEFVWSYLIRGLLHAEQLEFKSAEADFAKARELIQRSADRSAEYVLHVNRGALRARQGAYGAAVEDFTKAIALRPEQFQAYLNLGVIHGEQGRREEAVRLLAASLQPFRLPAAVGVALPWQDWRKLNEAAGQLGKAIEIKPELALLYRQRAQVHLLRNDRASALQDFRQAIRCERRGPETHKDHL
jgi:eukaryotic-like serine/threonine-protein kinase